MPIHEHRITVGHTSHINPRVPPHHGRRQIESLAVPYGTFRPDTALIPCTRHFRLSPIRIIEIFLIPSAGTFILTGFLHFAHSLLVHQETRKIFQTLLADPRLNIRTSLACHQHAHGYMVAVPYFRGEKISQ